jgi:hypothetical protein
MRKSLHWILLACAAAMGACGAERSFDFSQTPEGQLPLGFRSTVTGNGKPGNWKIVMEEVPPLLAPLTPQAPVIARRAVLAQTSQDMADEHYPLLIFDDDTYTDFTFKTRFKLVSGIAEQMAGLAFRIQDEKNYYYVRASGLGNSFYFFKFVAGELIGPIGSKVEITKGVWHEMAVECHGSEITCSLDGKVIIPQLRQDTFSKGKIGFWTKSDSVSYFADAQVSFTPIERLAQTLVREAVTKYSRVEDVKIFVMDQTNKPPHAIGSKDPKGNGEIGGEAESGVIQRSEKCYSKGKGTVTVTLPLRDRNGEVIAAVRVVLKSFPGQTEGSAVSRAAPIVEMMQGRAQTLAELIE